ncbi:MMPL family transporter [Virgibacillus sp. LDC1]|uniref:MMPL family transporter n=1 Tax=Paenibacillus sp. GM2FR TaxID=2059268 RepID=UPI000C26E1FC|nr:MMPL family transporter [Paenibacillus sp. GM2FR]MCV4232695.1 MMPL family transporter [Virgibacillus sp. LDC1]PJN56686.1 putative membrane protein YdgH [Paenibacillus sp. GM2FR]
MKAILKARWAIIVLWLAAAVVLFLFAPSMSDLVREKGQLSVPDGYTSSRAAEILKEASGGEGGETLHQVALVFNKPDGLSETDKESIREGVQALNDKKESLHIDSINEPFTQTELEDTLIAKDGKTIMVALQVSGGQEAVKELPEKVDQVLEGVQADHYLTSEGLINEDTIVSSEEGLKKTEYITVVFILLILFVVFRSFVAPFVPLLTVGLSYIVSQSVVSFLVDQFNFPISTFTQIFMVAVMFGIGTDYCILLISRFKEELTTSEDTKTAIIETYRKAGGTVLYSGLAVFVGFAAIGLSKFILYKSAVAVAIGIAVMLLALVTVVPFFMAVLGKKLFWPSRGKLEHSENKLWGAAGSFSLKRPWAALLVVAVIVAPFLATYSGKLSFNSLEEIGPSYASVKGFNIISDSFGPGQSLPSTIVIKNDDRMDTAEYMGLAEKISREVEKVDGVSSVRGLSRPTGEQINDFLIPTQVKTLNEGLGESQDGLTQIQNGLSEAGKQLSENTPKLNEAAAGAKELTKGTADLKDGITELGQGLSAIQKGIQSGSAGAGELKTGLAQAAKSAKELAAAHAQLLQGYKQLDTGLTALDGGVAGLKEQLGGVAAALSGLEGSFTGLESSHPELVQDTDYQTIKGTVTQTAAGTAELAAGLGQISEQLKGASAGLSEANAGYAKAAAGQTALADGLQQLVAGIAELQSGLSQAANGQGQIVSQIPSITGGLDQLQGGQKQLADGFGDLTGQIGELTEGLNSSADGLKQITDGLHSAQDYLQQIQDVQDEELSGFFIPQEALENEEFQTVFDTYLSDDRKVMTLDVVLATNPYSEEALGSVEQIQAAVDRAVNDTKLENAEVAISGITSTNNDLQNISNEDYSRTVILMLSGIFIILVVLLRSIVMPIYLIVSLLITYFTAVGVTEMIFVHGFGYSGITWATPFFSFVMLIALGVDYSIFLMARFNENKSWNVQDAILHAMRNMGTVILSAVVILGGTFAAMYPSGVLSMMQIATVVLVGLVLYALLFLPFFVPVMVRIFGRANWWPFTPKEQDAKGSPSGHDVGM